MVKGLLKKLSTFFNPFGKAGKFGNKKRPDLKDLIKDLKILKLV
jgi:hypothetical protein